MKINKSADRSDSTSSSSAISMRDMEMLVDKLQAERNRNSTRPVYYSVWKTFNQFFVRLDEKPATWEDRLTLFVAFLIQTNKKAGTIKSYISAIRAILLEVKVELKEDKFLLSSLTKACKLTNDHVRIRLPIKKGLLFIVLKAAVDFLGTNRI